ncbi:hypothetical protein HWV07_04925 [Natronomonas salina]|uniref:hypothetical protein n=1 Tax=Natronomonas salina TaxID=1710540 RepID=UPI0015B4053D|nr:hypothetical protein [Natronomonas salina]QLD88409.1 hypothetical protein HWV07_04925 [Natronomonas salina]
MDDATLARLRLLAGGLALFTAVVHLLHPSQGGVALLVYANAGYLGDPRPLVFTLGAFALISGVLLGYNGFAGRGLYLGGILVTLCFLVGFVVWHTALDHGAFWPHLEPNVHGGNPLIVAVEHLLGDPLALVSKLAELVLLVCLVVLVRVDG